MATTAIFAELLVIGLQAVVWITIAALGITKTRIHIPSGAEHWSALITLLVIAAAYILGVLIDRISDSMFKIVLPDEWPPSDKKPANDVEAAARRLSVPVVRLTVASKSEPAWNFLEYVRSRLRIARATSLNLVCATLAVTVWLIRHEHAPLRIAAALIVGSTAGYVTVWTARRISKTFHERLLDAYQVVVSNEK